MVEAEVVAEVLIRNRASSNPVVMPAKVGEASPCFFRSCPLVELHQVESSVNLIPDLGEKDQL